MNHKISDAQYIEAARRKFDEEGVIEIDKGVDVSRGADPGAYVKAWVWVSDDEIEDVAPTPMEQPLIAGFPVRPLGVNHAQSECGDAIEGRLPDPADADRSR